MEVDLLQKLQSSTSASPLRLRLARVAESQQVLHMEQANGQSKG
ncbi:hypothetical protein BH20VER2_BH20VER2_06040 [soil metagenome]